MQAQTLCAPDIQFSGTNHDGSVAVDIVDPDGHHISDAMTKLRGLNYFVERFADACPRIEAMA